MKKNKVLFVAPGGGNGGIRSWAIGMLNTFNNEEYEFVHIGVAHRRSARNNNYSKRIIDGLLDLRDTKRAIAISLKENRDISLMHITTSGGLGTFRDYVLAKYCKRHRIKTIMHCHYGCISEDYTRHGIKNYFLRKTMRLYDQIWVLDSRSERTLKSDPDLANKVFVTPNPIKVPIIDNIPNKSYKNVAFIGNLIPSKGIYELVEAITQCSEDTTLTIVGPGEESVVNHIREIAGDLIDNRVKFVGRLPNNEAIELMKTMDIIALPTYYVSEAFPISILEAMSNGKMVISTRRAAINDMLTALDGSECGYFVSEKSTNDIVDAIKWCQANSSLADERCRKAYQKVHSCYREDIIHNLYRSLYTKALSE